MHIKLFEIVACAALVIASSNANARTNDTTDAHSEWQSSYYNWNDSFTNLRLKRYFKQRFNRKQVSSIADAADRSGRLAGAAVSLSPFQADERYKSLLNAQFNYVTPENVAKWGELQPTNANEWSFEATDAMLENSEANDQLFKGHALVWHVQLPSFINENLTSVELEALTNTHINTVLSRYSGRIYAWDVVNEAISDGNEFYRDTVFLRKLGEDYIANAFHTAKAADPFTQLYYNDYGIERINTKSTKVYDMVKGLLEQGVPIDGVGFQMHLDAAFPPSIEQMVANFERFTALGLSVNISELDVRIANLPWDKSVNLAIQRQVYHRAADACMQVANCEGISSWGFTDRHSWIDSQFAPDDPLQYDEDYNRKPAYFGMLDGFIGLDADSLGSFPNLISNSSFESGTEGWAVTGGGQLKTISSRRVFGKKSSTGRRILLNNKRADNNSGPMFNLLGLLRPNQSYDVSSLVSIRGTYRDKVNALVTLQCKAEDSVQLEIGSIRARKYRWRMIEGEFMTPDCELATASLSFQGPSAGVKLLIDNPSVRPQQFVIAQNDDLGPNVLSNGGFELGTDSWFGFDTAIVETSEKAPYTGILAGFASGRSDNFDGIATSLNALVEPGSEYQLSSRIRISGATDVQTKATLRVDCPAGSQFLGIAGAVANDEQWSLLTGKITIPNCAATDLTLYFEGPDAPVNLFLDEVYLQKVLTEPTANLLTNSDFEENADGWFGFGAAFIATTSISSFQGEKSLLASNRTQTFEGPAIGLTDIVSPGMTYRFDGQTRIQGASSAPVRATLQVSCSGQTGEQYIGAASTTANNTSWSQLNGEFTVPDCELANINLFIEGPDGGTDILVDALSLEAVDGDTTPPNGNVITNSSFENSVAPWFGFGGAILETSNNEAFEGLQSLVATNRTANFEGPATDLVTAVSPSQTLLISAQVRIAGASEAEVSATIQTVCDDASEEYNGTATVQANDTGWVEVIGEITLPSCEASAQRLYFQGPAGGINILLDAVSAIIN